MNETTCAIGDCDRPRKNRQRVCAMHSNRKRRHGSYLLDVPPGQRRTKGIAERFWPKVNQEGPGCHPPPPDAAGCGQAQSAPRGTAPSVSVDRRKVSRSYTGWHGSWRMARFRRGCT